MADEVDRADAEIERHLQESLRRHQVPMAPGKPGECDLCGEWSGRLVNGACAPCRDKHKLK
jgi:hypothetical protein